MLPDIGTVSSGEKLNRAADILAQAPGSAAGRMCVRLCYTIRKVWGNEGKVSPA